MRLRPRRTRSWTCHLDRRNAGGGLASVLGDTVPDFVSSLAPYAPLIFPALGVPIGRLLLLAFVSSVAMYSSGARSRRALVVLAFLTKRPPVQ
jgi:hypothetical protein